MRPLITYQLHIDVAGTIRCLTGRLVAPGFGASDCAAGCGAHLKYLD